MTKITSIAGYLVFAALVSFGINCASVRNFPPIPDTNAMKAKAQAEKEQVYQQHGVNSEGRGYWINGVQYNYKEIRSIFDAPFISDSTKDRLKSAESMQGVADIFVGAGLGAVGGSAIGTLLIVGPAASGNSKPNMTPVGIAWGVTGVILITALILNGSANSKMAFATQGYNEDLYRALELQQKTSYNAVPLQMQYAHHTVEMSFRF